MIKNLTPLAAVAVALWASTVTAQETTSDSGSESGQSTNESLDLGQPVNAEPKVGDRYATDKFGDWNMACIKTNGDKDPCSLLQILNGPQGSPMAEMSLFRLPEGQIAAAGATVIVPLETLLTAQLTISIDGAPGKRYNYSFCSPVGCIAQIGLTQADVDAMKKGSTATISLVPAPAPDQVISLDLSLNGFTAGFDAVDVVSN